MSITIPTTVKKYYESKEATDAIDLLINNDISTNSLEDMEKYYKAKLFIDHFLYDLWNFRYQIFKEVWEPLLDKTTIIKNECDIKDFDYYFTIRCKINNNEYYLGISNLEADHTSLFVTASRIDDNGIEQAITNDLSGYTHLTELRYETEDNKDNENNEACTCGRKIDLQNKNEVTSEDIEELRRDAEDILKIIRS